MNRVRSKRALEVSIKRKFVEYTPADHNGASDRLIDFTVELRAIEMEPLVPRAGSTAADLRPMLVDTGAAPNDVAKLVMKTDKALVEELAPSAHRGAPGESLRREALHPSVQELENQMLTALSRATARLNQQRVSKHVVK